DYSVNLRDRLVLLEPVLLAVVKTQLLALLDGSRRDEPDPRALRVARVGQAFHSQIRIRRVVDEAAPVRERRVLRVHIKVVLHPKYIIPGHGNALELPRLPPQLVLPVHFRLFVPYVDLGLRELLAHVVRDRDVFVERFSCKGAEALARATFNNDTGLLAASFIVQVGRAQALRQFAVKRLPSSHRGRRRREGVDGEPCDQEVQGAAHC
ncbi:unnamed protein product, partial [Pelagomonas calceolata]